MKGRYWGGGGGGRLYNLMEGRYWELRLYNGLLPV